MRLLIVTLALIGVAAAEDPMLSVFPHATIVGGNVRITCRVPRNPRNRVVVYGFKDWTTTSRQLDGEDSRITHQILLEGVPCDPGELFCTVLRADGKDRQVVVPFTVVGCDR